MAFENDSNSKAVRKGRAKSNPENKISDDNLSSRDSNWLTNLKNKNLRNASKPDNTCVKVAAKLTKNMVEKDILMELYMIEGEDGFDSLTSRAKVSKISKSGDKDFCSWLFEKGSCGELPDDWIALKKCIVQYCTSAGLENTRMYSEELLSDYLIRLMV
jgi:hypothetical protein